MLMTCILLCSVLPKTAPGRKFIFADFIFLMAVKKEVCYFLVKPFGNTLTRKLTCCTLQLTREVPGIIPHICPKVV